MKINTIKIKNFRGIPDMEISLERISFFTGPCGAGKTSVLKAFNFALTGDVKKDDIREQSDRASATLSSATIEVDVDQSLKLVYAANYSTIYLGLVDSTGYEATDNAEPSYVPDSNNGGN